MKFQIVIIGSGLGGLLSAVLLAKEGYSVAVVEQNKQIGGCLQTFSFDKKVFDSAVHYIGGLGKNEALFKIFNYAGIMSSLKIKQLDIDCFDKIIFDDDNKTYQLAQGKEQYIKQLSLAFPDEVSKINKYFQLLEDTCNAYPLYNLREGDAEEKRPFESLSLSTVLDELQLSPKLRNVILGNAILYAGEAKTSAWSTHALVTKSYIDSAWRCEGGASQIAKLLWKELQKYGGVIFKNEKIEHLSVKDNLIVAAHSQSGKVFYADSFISNIHPKQTIALLEDKNLLKSVYRNRVNNATESIGCLMVNVVFHAQKVTYKNYNVNWNIGNPIEAIDKLNTSFPVNYSLYYTEDNKYKGFAESVSVLTYVDQIDFETWYNTHNCTNHPSIRDEAYQTFKTEKAKQLLSKIEQAFPEIVEHMQSWKIATPLSYRDYQGSGIGSLYGIQKDINNRMATQFSTKTRIDNLYLTGQNINLHGVLGVSMTALQTVASFVGMDTLLKKINS